MVFVLIWECLYWQWRGKTVSVGGGIGISIEVSDSMEPLPGYDEV